MTGTPPLVDGGNVTVPTFGIYDTKGEWIIESYGVDPDVEPQPVEQPGPAGVVVADEPPPAVRAQDGRPLGLVHCDVNPPNVMVSLSSRVP